jgi:hypothetical protein
MIPAASRFSRPMIVGRKYRRTRKSRVSTGHPLHDNLGATDTPARLCPMIRIHRSKCFPGHRARLFLSSCSGRSSDRFLGFSCSCRGRLLRRAVCASDGLAWRSAPSVQCPASACRGTIYRAQVFPVTRRHRFPVERLCPSRSKQHCLPERERIAPPLVPKAASRNCRILAAAMANTSCNSRQFVSKLRRTRMAQHPESRQQVRCRQIGCLRYQFRN